MNLDDAQTPRSFCKRIKTNKPACVGLFSPPVDSALAKL
jgi:hypothetical protein